MGSDTMGSNFKISACRISITRFLYAVFTVSGGGGGLNRDEGLLKNVGSEGRDLLERELKREGGGLNRVFMILQYVHY